MKSRKGIDVGQLDPEADYKLGYRDGIVAGEVDRAAIIEECARVAQQWLIRAEQGSGEDLIDAIRDLKSKAS